MKIVKKFLSIALVLLMLFSTLTIGVSASSTTNIKVVEPRRGAEPSDRYSVSNSIIDVIAINWLEKCPGDNQYHYMSYGDEFERGNYYRVYITFDMNPNTTASPLTHPITINGKAPTNRSGFHLYYDFGKLGLFGCDPDDLGDVSGGSGGLGGGSSHGCEFNDNDMNGYCDLCNAFVGYAEKVYAKVSYREKATFDVVCDNLPKGVNMVLYEYDSPNKPIVVSNAGYFGCTTDNLKKQDIYIVRLVDKNGNIVANTSQVTSHYIIIDVEDSFGLRISSFFKKLFGADMKVDIGTYNLVY